MTPKRLPLSTLRGPTADEVRRLERAGIRDTAALVRAAPSTSREQKLARAVGIPLGRLREAVNRADLVQVKGVGPATADLLENAGVNSAKELAQRNPKTLATVLERYAQSHRELNERAPDARTVAVLVERARALYDTTAVGSLEQAKDRAHDALTDYVDRVLFGTDPEGASYRTEILQGHSAAEVAAIHAEMLHEVNAFLGRGPSTHQNSEFDPNSSASDATGFLLVGRLSGLYTEVHVRKDDGRADHILVEVD